MMSNVSDNGSGEQRQRSFAVVSLAVLIAAVLGGCSVSPEAAKPQVRTAVARQNNTYVVQRASIRTPATDRAYKHQAQSRPRTASVRKPRHQAGKPRHQAGKPRHQAGKPRHQAGKPRHQAGKPRHQAGKRKPVVRPVARRQIVREQPVSRKKQAPARQTIRSKRHQSTPSPRVRKANLRGHNGQKRLTRAQYQVRYKAQKQAAAKAVLQRRYAKARALAEQQRVKQQAIHKQHIARWEQQQEKRRQYNNSWKYKQAQKAISTKKVSKRVVQMARRPAAPVKPRVKPRPARRPVVYNQQRGRQVYLARWQRMQEEKRFRARKAEAEKRSRVRKAEVEKRLRTQKAAQKVERVIQNAKKQIGRKYVWGGASPRQGFDCSGLVQHSIKKGANVKVPRTAAQQYKAAIKVPQHKAERGDLIFFITRGKSVSHVGIYLGNNKFVHAPRTGKRVTTSKLSSYWKKRFVGFGRIPGACRLPI